MAFSDHTDEVYDAIKAYLTANWTDTTIRWPNEGMANAKMDPFVAVEIHGVIFGQVSMGAAEQEDNRWDESGTLWMHVTVKRGAGMKAARGAAKYLATLFRGTRLLSDRLEFMDAVIGPGASGDEEGNWFVVSVSVDWQLMEA